MSETQVIEPTVGRIVHFYPDRHSSERAAIVACVHDTRCVNLGVFTFSGSHEARTSVPLVQPGENPPSAGPFCCWMPYQVKKAHGSESGDPAAGTEAV